jgi:site-specific recombinase XerC
MLYGRPFLRRDDFFMHLGTHLFSDAFDMFLLDCEARRLTPATREFYKVKLSRFIRWCESEGVHALHELTAHHIRHYLVHLSRRKLSSQYQHNLARSIRAFLNYCIRDELLEKSPFDKVQMPRLEKKFSKPSPQLTFMPSCVVVSANATKHSAYSCSIRGFVPANWWP